MALIKYSAMIADASGTVGGNVFARNKAGNYVRKWAKPTNAPTIKQSNARGMFSAGNAAWRALTEAQRDAWAALSMTATFLNKLGESVNRSGLSNFMMCYQNAACAISMGNTDVSLPTDAPPDLNAPSVPEQYTLAADISGTSLTISSSLAQVPADQIFVVEATPELPPTKNNATTDYRSLEVLGTASNFDTVNLWADYIAAFAVPNAGCRISMRIKTISMINNVASSYALGTAIVTS